MKLPSERRMVATAVALRAMLGEMKFPPSAEIAITGFLFGLLLREIPESARPQTLSAFNDIIEAAVDDDA